ncbi:MAG: cyanophycinase [Planctomycetota bacterium]|nr:cyanophycinase [Planctomycetota bacterium]MDG2143834.1 cyanophycinase [Planctomycetota bacterium]
MTDNIGYIIPIGGAEEKVRDAQILTRFVEVAGGDQANIAIIPTASRLKDTGDRYATIFQDLGVKEAFCLPYETRADCKRADWLDKLSKATAIFMTGGNQLRLSTLLGGTPVADMIRERNATDNLHVAGTSAGASIMAEHMIAYGDEGPTPRSDMVTLAPGLGLTHRAIIDQHFGQRNRIGRLMTSLAYNPRPIGIGLDEDTAAFIDHERKLTVVGSGAITIIDPGDLEFSSMDSARRHEAVCLINMRLHVLIEGCTYDMVTRLASPAPLPELS